MAGEHEVWARMVWAAVALAPEVELPVARLLEGLPFDEAGLRRRKRVAWDDYSTIYERLAEAAGGYAELSDVLAGSYHNVLPEMRALAGSLITPKAFMRFTWEVLDPLVFPPVDFRYEDLGEDRICIGAHLRPGVKPCEVYFAASTGAVLGMMQHLGLPPVEILSVDVAPDHGIWDMRLPPARTIVHRITRSIMRFVIGSESDGTPIHATLGSPEADPLHARLEHATAQWKLTPRQAEVLALVVAGKANKEIAHSLECADNTVELHVTRVLRKSKLTSRNQLIARFWSADWGFPL